MSKLLKKALEEERNHYTKKLISIGACQQDILHKMTITELRKEYFYFFRKDKASFKNK
ncbi:stress protein [Bacillus sp. CLL-7-23]|uniref:Stress protein n=1 Tax=Bacillus changyiensis TaxID=3004103 RepID=A0ABT4X483_9BACI|nr:stress protein [Bacillus changyiensis]MDA7026197.1 stress protein [Bacillus changyiensis]